MLDIFLVFSFSSAQINNISAIYCWCGISGYAKNVGIFLGQTNSEVGIFWDIKYEPLSDPPPPKKNIKISKWAP